MNPALPWSVETGWSSPENWIVGTMVRIAVTKTAATWLLVKVEVTIPMPVVAVTYSSVQSVNIKKLPLIGTPKHDQRQERSG